MLRHRLDYRPIARRRVFGHQRTEEDGMRPAIDIARELEMPGTEVAVCIHIGQHEVERLSPLVEQGLIAQQMPAAHHPIHPIPRLL